MRQKLHLLSDEEYKALEVLVPHIRSGACGDPGTGEIKKACDVFGLEEHATQADFALKFAEKLLRFNFVVTIEGGGGGITHLSSGGAVDNRSPMEQAQSVAGGGGMKPGSNAVIHGPEGGTKSSDGQAYGSATHYPDGRARSTKR